MTRDRFSLNSRQMVWIGVCLSALLALGAYGQQTRRSIDADSTPAIAGQAQRGEQATERDGANGAGKDAQDDPKCAACSTFVKVCFDSQVPGDALLSEQSDADCFAWWEFITLNWPTTEDAEFGAPGDLSAVQWQTYMTKGLLMQPGGVEPPAWGTQPTVPPDCLASAGLTAADVRGTSLLFATSKFTTDFDFPDSISEAAPQNSPNWLGAQNGTNLWFEIRVNKDEYDYIVDKSHKFYNADNQASWVKAGNSINLPAGQKDGPTGAIELKAAWMEVPDPTDSKWNRYKLSQAVVVDPTTQKCRVTTVALVGFHILHKTTSQPTWIWATFEHVDNVPGTSGDDGAFNFYNKNCQPKQVTSAPTSGDCQTPMTVSVGCTPNTSPPYYLCAGGPGPVPIQVTRSVPIDDDAKKANDTAQAAIRRRYPNSVWQYYQLINVIWSTNPASTPTKPTPVPRALNSMLPDTKVANVTLETYAQNLTCTDCHKFATIAPANSKISSDFSFVIGAATAPATSD